jgi:hypothetical protein
MFASMIETISVRFAVILKNEGRNYTMTSLRITVTGADEKTSISDLVTLCSAYPLAEVGLLYTATPEGRNRYPSYEWLDAATNALAGRCALHVCGSGAREQLRSGNLRQLTERIARVQVNGIVSVDDAIQLASMVRTLITQQCPANVSLIDAPISNHVLLVDGSGGRGVSPLEWLRPETDKEVGFAGGIGPDNLRDELCKIALVADGEWWIDMEGKLRQDDWFDLEAARSVVDQFHTVLAAIV